MKRSAAPQLYAELISTPEIRAIQARRLVLERVGSQIRELLAELHGIRCARIETSGAADRALAMREAELDVRIIVLRGGDAPE